MLGVSDDNEYVQLVRQNKSYPASKNWFRKLGEQGTFDLEISKDNE